MSSTYVLLFRPVYEKVRFQCKDVLLGYPHEVVSECFKIEKGVTVDNVSGLPFPIVSVKPSLSEIYDEIKGKDVIVILPEDLKSSLLFIASSFLSSSRVFYVDDGWLREWDLSSIYTSLGVRFLDDRMIPDTLPELKRALWYFRNGITFLFIKEMEEVESSITDDLTMKMFSSISLSSGDDVAKVEEMVRLYVMAGYYDKAISLGRELPIIYCMKKRGYGKLEFDENNRKNVYMMCRRAVRKVLRESYPDFLDLRNYLMHTGLSGSFDLEIRDGIMGLSEKRRDMIKQEKVKEVAEHVLDLAKEIYEKAEEILSSEG